jgi:hypothetical protein
VNKRVDDVAGFGSLSWKTRHRYAQFCKKLLSNKIQISINLRITIIFRQAKFIKTKCGTVLSIRSAASFANQ